MEIQRGRQGFVFTVTHHAVELFFRELPENTAACNDREPFGLSVKGGEVPRERGNSVKVHAATLGSGLQQSQQAHAQWGSLELSKTRSQPVIFWRAESINRLDGAFFFGHTRARTQPRQERL